MRRLLTLAAVMLALSVLGCGSYLDGTWKYDKTEPVAPAAGNGMPADYADYAGLKKVEPCDLLTPDEAATIIGGEAKQSKDKEYNLRHSDMLRLDCVYTPADPTNYDEIVLSVLTPGSKNAATAVGNTYAMIRPETVVPGYGRFAYWTVNYDFGVLSIWHEGRSVTIKAADLPTAKRVADVVLPDL